MFCTAHSLWNDLEILINDDGTPLIFSSEFPIDFGYKIYYPANYPFIWREGDDISGMVDETKLTYTSHYLNGGYYGYDDYGNCESDDTQDTVKDDAEALQDAYDYLDKFYDFNEEKGVYEPKKGVVLE